MILFEMVFERAIKKGPDPVPSCPGKMCGSRDFLPMSFLSEQQKMCDLMLAPDRGEGGMVLPFFGIPFDRIRIRIEPLICGRPFPAAT